MVHSEPLLIWFEASLSSVFLGFTALMLLLLCVFQKSNMYLQKEGHLSDSSVLDKINKHPSCTNQYFVQCEINLSQKIISIKSVEILAS